MQIEKILFDFVRHLSPDKLLVTLFIQLFIIKLSYSVQRFSYWANNSLTFL